MEPNKKNHKGTENQDKQIPNEYPLRQYACRSMNMNGIGELIFAAATGEKKI